MGLTAEKIIQTIVQQANLSREEVIVQIEQLQQSLKYEIEADSSLEGDPTIPKLLAQELNVDLGNPADYLYVELIYDIWPLFARIIPLTTVDKEKIIKIITTIGPDQETRLRQSPWKLNESAMSHPLGIILVSGLKAFARDGVLFYVRPYPQASNDDSLLNYTLDDIVRQAELYRTFTDYRIVRSGGKTYIPYSLFVKIYITPPDWVTPVGDENRFGSFKFPYITLEALSPDVETLVFVKSATKEIIGVEALQNHPNLRIIHFKGGNTPLERLKFPPTLSLPCLEHLTINGASLQHILDLSFIQNCPNLKTIRIMNHPHSDSSIHKLTVPPLLNHRFLKGISIRGSYNSIVLTPPWNCPNLQELILVDNSLDTIDLRPLENCPSLRVFVFNCYQRETFDLSPFRHCPDLEELSLCDSQIEELDLSPLEHCSNLRELALSYNRLKHIDLSPLQTHPTLEKVYLQKNDLESLDLSPLVDCPNLRFVDLKGNPLANLPSLVLERFYQQDLEIIL